ncbi:TolC family protein [Chitinophaga pinensis]|uniref:Outer membrane efflux protein n=1 Tax=Chitinophaga pinensis (strain ATCC 43595 / DSM 2588 / LMG 13176 / NBRC 15968 / NCIMB 11800 / UQM 2034) TaxID=485918 RepID=A0A979H0K1_CHIPD|nr:TolC family protein [Chitinophaga pinensis]ACU63530.1 outer membrane efflux protein [Chitinophaga pinensis DSM 2588]
MRIKHTNTGYSCLLLSCLSAAILLMHITIANGQTANNNTYKISLNEAVEFAKIQNKLVQAANFEETAMSEDKKDVYKAVLPDIRVNGSYQRFSGLTLFNDGLRHANTEARRPTSTSAALGIEALFNIYSGGKQKALQREYTFREKLEQLNTKDQSGIIAYQTAAQYLELVRLNEQEKFIHEQVKRAAVRVKDIHALYDNQKVTRSDVLRAEVNLSNVRLSLEQNENDIAIANQKLVVLMNVPDAIHIIPLDSAGMLKPDIHSLLPIADAAETSSYSVLKAAKNVEIQKEKVKGVRSNNKPNLSFYSGYGINYPNYLFFPPVDQAYAIGFAGLKAQYSISSVYHNKSRIAAAKLRVKELELRQQASADNIRSEAKAYYAKYAEALSRITVNEHSVQQTEVNYRIVNNKYLNQLALLTDLLDADNLYQESQFNLVKAQTEALVIYYRLLYTSGNL